MKQYLFNYTNLQKQYYQDKTSRRKANAENCTSEDLYVSRTKSIDNVTLSN